MLQPPTGQPNEKDLLLFNIEFSRHKTMQIIEEIRNEYGLDNDILDWGPGLDAHTIGWLLGHIGANEWMTTNRMHKIVQKPPVGGDEIWNRFVCGSKPPDRCPPAEEILKGMAEVRVHFRDVLRSSSHAILDTVLMPEIDLINWTIRFAFMAVPMHERFHSGEIRYIHKFLLPGRKK